MSYLCSYSGVTGKCRAEALANSSFCFWHDSKADKSSSATAAELERRAKTGIPMEGFCLHNANLAGINLTTKGNPYKLINSDLSRADFTGAHLYGVCLSGSSLLKTNFTNANLNQTNLSGCDLLGTNFNNTRMESIIWGKYLKQELLAKQNKRQKKFLYREAEEICRMMKKYLDSRQLHDIASYFSHKEMLMRRKQMPKLSVDRIASWLIDCISGYGEYPRRLFLFVLFCIIIFSVIYFLTGINNADTIIVYSHLDDYHTHLNKLAKCIYFSIVTFTTLGYGDITPNGISRLFAVIEAMIGNFSLALFVVLCVAKSNK